MVTIEHDPEKDRFSAIFEGKEVGYLTYEIDDGVLTVTHTVVDPSMRGQGIAKQLVLACSSFAGSSSLQIASVCSYASAVLGIEDRNPSCRI